MLPPISSMEATGPRPQHDNLSSVRHQYTGNGHARHFTISTATSADSSDVEEDTVEELPAQGLLAPWEVLRGLADVAIQKAAKASRLDLVYDLCRSCTLVSAGKRRSNRVSKSHSIAVPRSSISQAKQETEDPSSYSCQVPRPGIQGNHIGGGGNRLVQDILSWMFHLPSYLRLCRRYV